VGGNRTGPAWALAQNLMGCAARLAEGGLSYSSEMLGTGTGSRGKETRKDRKKRATRFKTFERHSPGGGFPMVCLLFSVLVEAGQGTLEGNYLSIDVPRKSGLSLQKEKWVHRETDKYLEERIV